MGCTHDSNNGERQLVLFVLHLDGDGRLSKRSEGVVDRDRVMWVRGIARDIAYDCELAVWRRECLVVDEGWDRVGQVDL